MLSKLARFFFGQGLIGLRLRASTSTDFLSIRWIWCGRRASNGDQQPLSLSCVLTRFTPSITKATARNGVGIKELVVGWHRSCTPPQARPHRVNPNDSATVEMEYNGSPRTDVFTQSCRDVIRSLTYESILACTVYAPAMLFMVGPAAILANHSLTIVTVHSLFGFAMSWTIHRMGHRLLAALPGAPQKIHFSPRRCLPGKQTFGQFVCMLEMLVAAATFLAIAAMRLFGEDPVCGLILIVLGLALYFLPVYLSKLWAERYYPKLALLGPTEDVIKKSFPGLRSFTS